MLISAEQPYGGGRLRGTFWYNVLYNRILYQQNVDECSNGTTDHIDEKWAHAQQKYNSCQHLVRSRKRMDSQSGESLGSAFNVSRSSTCMLMFSASTYRQARAWSEYPRQCRATGVQYSCSAERYQECTACVHAKLSAYLWRVYI